MKAVEALDILLSSASNRECKHQLKRLLASECRNLVRVLLRGRPSGAENAPPSPRRTPTGAGCRPP